MPITLVNLAILYIVVASIFYVGFACLAPVIEDSPVKKNTGESN